MRPRTLNSSSTGTRSAAAISAMAVLAGVFVAACAAKSAAPYPDVESFCAAKAQAECQIASTCGIDPNVCQMQRVSVCEDDAMTAASTGSMMRVYTQANASACIGAVSAAFGNGNTRIPYAQWMGPMSITDVCERVFSGNVATGANCESNYDCANDDLCSPAAPGATKDVCEPAQPVALGSPCENPGSVCMMNSYCAMSPSGVYECTASQEDGQSCVAAPCIGTERCETTGATGSTCEPRVAANQPCSTSDDCAPAAPYCDPYAIDASTGKGTCTQGLSFATQAADCKAFEPGQTVAVGPDAGGTD